VIKERPHAQGREERGKSRTLPKRPEECGTLKHHSFSFVTVKFKWFAGVGGIAKNDCTKSKFE
jgi:hypothetical protein